MTREEKIKKAVAVAVAYYVEQEKALSAERASKARTTGWNKASKAIHMNAQRIIQQRGSISRPKSLFRHEEPHVKS